MSNSSTWEALDQRLLALFDDPTVRHARHELDRDLREYAPVFRSSRGQWFVTGYDEALAVLRDGRRWTTEPVAAGRPEHLFRAGGPVSRAMVDAMVLWRDGAVHARLRKRMAAPFHPRHAERLRGEVTATLDGLLDGIEGKGAVDFLAEVALPLPLLVVWDLIGLPREDIALFEEWHRAWQVVAPGSVSHGYEPTADEYAEAECRFERYLDYLRPHVDLRRATPRDDMLTSFGAGMDEGELDEVEVAASTLFTIVAGHDTTGNVIANGLYHLLARPPLWRAVVEDPTLAGPAAEEAMRFESSAINANPRYALEDTEVGGQLVRRGDKVIVVLNGANRDGRAFDDPEEFLLGREPNRHIAFGGGAHYCAGAVLARIEVRAALEATARRFPGMVLDGTPAWNERWGIRGLVSLPVRFPV